MAKKAKKTRLKSFKPRKVQTDPEAPVLPGDPRPGIDVPSTPEAAGQLEERNKPTPPPVPFEPTGKTNCVQREVSREQRRSTVAGLYLAGHSQLDIALKMGMSIGTVAADLAHVRQEWLASAVRDFDQKKAEELAKIDRLESEAWAAWNRSREDAQTKRDKVEMVRVKLKEPDERGRRYRMKAVGRRKESVSQGQYGDVRFLEQVSWCIDTRIRIMGLYKAPEGQAVLKINWDDLFTRRSGDGGGRAEAPRLGDGRPALPAGEVIDAAFTVTEKGGPPPSTPVAAGENTGVCGETPYDEEDYEREIRELESRAVGGKE